MTQVYEVLDTLKDFLRDSSEVDTVTSGDISKVDLNKTTIFPLAHIDLNKATYRGSVIEFQVSFLFLDIVDENKAIETVDSFYGNDNLQDVHNTQLTVVTSLIESLRRGELFNDLFQLIDEPVADIIVDRFENTLAGWGLVLNIQIPNTGTVCL